jgi:hypothetical protein
MELCDVLLAHRELDRKKTGDEIVQDPTRWCQRSCTTVLDWPVVYGLECGSVVVEEAYMQLEAMRAK